MLLRKKSWLDIFQKNKISPFCFAIIQVIKKEKKKLISLQRKLILLAIKSYFFDITFNKITDINQ